MLIGYHASHEQFSPSQLLEYVQAAEGAGFQAVMTSDHLAPWSARQGNSGNNWAWLGAVMAKTTIPFGSLAIPGSWRYHPVVLAHLIATLSEMFPDRLRWIAMGSGEALNETAVGRGWPKKAERNLRTEAGAEMIRRLLTGDVLNCDQPDLRARDARLWTLPEKPPALFGAALTSETARWLGTWADGLLTVRKPREELKPLVEAFRAGGGKDKPLALQLQVSWARTVDEARHAAWDQWRNATVQPDLLAELRTPEEFDEATLNVKPGDIDDVIPLVTQGRHLLDLINGCAGCGFDEVYVHSVGRDQNGFINFMRDEVLPKTALFHQRS